MRATMLALVVSIMVLSGCQSKPEEIAEAKYPTYHRTKVELGKDKSGSGGRVRFLVYNEERTKLIGAENQFGDGSTEYEDYRDDGTLRELNGFYPAGKDGTGQPKVKRTVLFDRNGKTVLFERLLRPDGTIEMLSRSRADGGKETETFFPDGKTTRLHKIVTAKGEVTLEEVYRQNGKLEMQTRKVGYDTTEITEYRENGARLSVTTRGSNRWSPVEVVVFDNGGIMVEQKIRYTSSQVEIEYRRADGTLAEKRSYSRYSGVTVTTYGADGKPQYRQEWRNGTAGDNFTDMSKARLTKIEELKPDGSVEREIELRDDGKSVKSTRVRDGGGYYSGTYRYFREDGTLEKEEVKVDYNTVKETKEFTPEDNIRETIPDERLKLSERPHPKMLSVMPEDQPYNPYGEGYPYDPNNPDFYDPEFPYGYPYGSRFGP